MDIEEIKIHQRTFLNNQKSRKIPIVFTIEGVEITVNAGVFPPATDTKLLASHIRVSRGIRTLDLTTGSGITSVIAGLQGANGIAVDINPEAIKNAKQNFSRYNVEIKTILSNLFEKVPLEKFDQIYVNGPFIEGEIKHPLDYSCYGAKEFMKAFLKHLPYYLKNNGKALIVLAEWADMEYFNKVASENNVVVSFIDKKSSGDGQRTYNLYELKLP